MQNTQPNRGSRASYVPPEIKTDRGCTYNKWGALAIVYGINVPFLSRWASKVKDDEDFLLWTSPRLVLTIAEAHVAYKNDNHEHNQGLMQSAIDFCNTFLPEDSKLAETSLLRLTWAQYGIASVTCEENRKNPGVFMDVVRHGHNTMILNAPYYSNDDSINRLDSALVLTPTGTPFEPKKPRDPRSPLNPNRRSGNSGKKSYIGI